MFGSSNPKSTSLYKNVFTETLDPSVIFDEKGDIGYVNKSLLKIGSYELEGIKGKKLDFLVPEEEKGRVGSLIEEVLKKKITFREFNTFFLTKDGEKIPVALTVIPLLMKEDLIGGLAFFVDIRQLKGLLESLSRAKLELEERVRERTRELEKKTSELVKTQKDLEEAKGILEVKVQNRTKELRELNRTLEQRVAERTKELQERVEELNKWFKLTVERELKMVELKEEIERIKKEEEKG